MSDQWLLIAAVMTPPVLILIVLVAKYDRLYKIVDLCTNWINKLVMKFTDRWIAEPLNKKLQEKRRQQREENLILLRKEQLEKEFYSHKRPH